MRFASMKEMLIQVEFVKTGLFEIAAPCSGLVVSGCVQVETHEIDEIALAWIESRNLLRYPGTHERLTHSHPSRLTLVEERSQLIRITGGAPLQLG